MPYPSSWLLTDAFSVSQAACLWVDEDPAASKYRRTPKAQSDVEAIAQLLSAAIQSGELKADSSLNVLKNIGDFSKSVVTKRELQNFAQSKGQFPAFLFNTLMPDQPDSRPPVPELPVSGAPDSPAPKNKGGRPREYDWDAFMIEIIRVANSPDGLPDTQAELIRDMLQWCENNWGKQPADSYVRSKISLIYNGLADAKNLD